MISSTVESKPVAATPPISITTGRTSVTRIRASFSTASQQETNTIDAIILPLSTDNMAGSKERSSRDVLEEQPAESLPGPIPERPMPRGFFRLISPVWNKNDGRSGPSSSGGLLRRSRKGQARSSKTNTRRRMMTESGKSDDGIDDVSPTSSAGPSSPRAMGPVRQEPEHTLDGSAEPYWPSMNVQDMSPPTHPKPLTGIKSGTTLRPKVKELGRNFDLGVSSSVTPEFIRKQKHTNPQISDEAFRHPPTTPGESTALPSSTGAQSPPSSQRMIATKEMGPRRGGTGGGSLLCSPLPSPFRRNRTNSKSLVDEPISIYQGLVKPGMNLPYSLRSSQIQINDEPKPNILLKGDSRLNSKRKTTSWVPSKLTRLSIKRNKNKKTSDEVGSEKVSSSNQKRKTTQSPIRARKPEGEPQPEN